MSIFKKIATSDMSDLAKNIGNAFDQNFTSQDEKLQARNSLVEQATTLVRSLQELQSKIIEIESTGNWLQRSWRPLVMLTFAFIVIYAYFIQPAFFPNAVVIFDNLDPQFWELLKIGMGGYVIGRSTEKVAKSVSENMSINVFKRKKNNS